MNKAQFFSKIENGRMTVGCRNSIVQALLSLNGKWAKITIEEHKKIRSSNQNGYYWSVVVPPIVNLFNENGNNVDAAQVHEFLKAEVGKLNGQVILPDGGVKQISGSSAVLQTMQFEEYLEKIRAWAAQWNLIIPMPNEHNFN